MRFLPSLFSVALFTSAFLSFSIQPILGKMLLPMVGGAPAGWIVAMAFFQLALLGGYGISYFLGRFSPWIHASALIFLYAIGAYFVPPVLPQISGDVQGAELSLAVVKALCQSVFVPFLALTATTAALQRVFAATNDPTAKDPYYLFVASNAGSFAGLFIYPFILEPMTGIAWQSHIWKGIYAAAVILIMLACAAAWKNKAVKQKSINTKTNKKNVSKSDIAKWLILSFIPCSLSMGVTTLITTDIGGLPLFWVIPLGLYLLTFILAFASKPLLNKENTEFAHIVAGVLIVAFLALQIGYQPTGEFSYFITLAIVLLGIFFTCAWACHQRLADSRPSTDNLTQFYFIVALGGALGGVLHAFIIPFVLPAIIEFFVMTILSLLVVRDPLFTKKNISITKLNGALIYIVPTAVVMLLIGFGLRMSGYPKPIYTIFSVIFIALLFFTLYRPRYVVLLGVLALATNVIGHYPGNVLEVGRNFFGVYAVYDIKVADKPVRVFSHGNTVHGIEVLTVKKPQDMDYGYYLRGGPVDDVMQLPRIKTVAILGLGAGQLACFKPSLTTDFYEIDPEIEAASRNHFSYLTRCPVRDVIIGDGRLKLIDSGRKYDMIFLDAFSSDGIPIHLVTQEAIQTYRKHLNPGGVILFHISNRYLKLSPVLAAVTKAEGLNGYKKYFNPKNKKDMLQRRSFWFVMTADKNIARGFENKGWKKEQFIQSYVWTDDRSSLTSAFSWEGAHGEAQQEQNH